MLPTELRIKRFLSLFELHGRWLFSLLATLLLTILLYHEVPGQYLTVAWGLEGIVLLFAGLLAQERVLRLCGLVHLALCVSKLFLFDLAGLDVPYRILSFTLLGLLLLAGALAYTKYRKWTTPSGVHP